MIPLFAVLRIRAPYFPRCRIWIPLFLVWILLLPFVLMLLPFFLVACWVFGQNPTTVLTTFWGVLAATKGTEIEVAHSTQNFFLSIQ
jgi:hypothetical protein